MQSITRRGLALAALSLFVGTSFAQSQESSPDQTQVLPAIVVTGTNLPPGPPTTVSVPVTVLGTEQIADTGVATDLLSVLRKAMPQFTGNANLGIENATSEAFFTMGGSAISVHNLDTLVLVDGRRVAVDPAVADTGGNFVDVNMIPPSAIDHVEVLSDGASAIYGSDAVGGVVNIILKKDFNGWDAGIHWGESDNHGHYTERQAHLTGGVSNGSTSVLVSVEGTETSPVMMSERGYSNPIYGPAQVPGSLMVTSFTTGPSFYLLAPGLSAPPGGGQYAISDLVGMGVYQPASPGQLALNEAPEQTLIESLKRESALLNMSQKIFGDHLVLFGSLLYGEVRTQSSMVAQPMSPYVSTPVTDFAVYQTTPPPPGPYAYVPYIPVSQPNNPFSESFIDQGNLVNVNNVFTGHPIETMDTSRLIRLVAGLRGQFGGGYSWEAGVDLNRYHVGYMNPGQINTAALNAAFAAGAINPFSAAQPAASALDGVLGARTDDMLSTLQTFDFLVRGSPFELPSGAVSFAAGAQYKKERVSASPDANSEPLPGGLPLPAWLSYQSLIPFDASRNDTSVFAEVKIPLAGPSQAIPGLRSLSVDLAGNEDSYSIGGHSSVPQAGLLYQPFDEQLTLRASAGRTFEVPTLYDLYAPVQSGVYPGVTFTNAAGGQTTANFNAFGGSNPDLRPSTSNTWSTGFILSPKAAPGFDLSFDYFEVVQKEEIGRLSAAAIAQGVDINGPSSPYAQYVHVGNPAGPSVTGPGQISANPSAIYLYIPLINLSSQSLKGFDVTLDYKHSTPASGQLLLSSTLTAYSSYLLQAIPTEDYYQYAGDASGGGSSSQGTIPRWRTYTSVDWRVGAWDAVIGHTYVPRVTDIGPGGDAATAPVGVGSYQQFDAILGYRFPAFRYSGSGRVSVRIGADNVFNRMPPVALNAFPLTNSDVGTYGGAIGRLWFVDATYDF
jgi:iron complex outermembrane receptor protein